MGFYANQMNCSIRHLTENIKKYSGKTPSQWLNNVLISKIKVDLLQNNKSVTQLVSDYNFSDNSVLYSFFKRVTGYSPQQYRTKMLNEGLK
jgi:AraC-like DNA-binding protein